MKKRKWKPTFYSILVLLVLLGTGLNLWHRENPLLNKKSAITLYQEVYVGQMSEFRTENFFPNDHFDYDKVTYDVRDLNVDEPGVYWVPVLFDGKETNCAVQVTVKAEETEGNYEEAPAGSGAFIEAGTEAG